MRSQCALPRECFLPRQTRRHASDPDHVHQRLAAEAFDKIGKIGGGVGIAGVPRGVRGVGKALRVLGHGLDLRGEFNRGEPGLAPPAATISRVLAAW